MAHLLTPRSVACSIFIALVALSSAAAASGDEPTGTRLDSPTASRDGSKLAFVSDASGSYKIWISNRDGSHAHELGQWDGSAQLEPDWSPDGQKIAFASPRGGDKFNIWVI